MPRGPRPPSRGRRAPLASSRESMVMTVFFVQPVSSRRAAVSSMMVMGARSHRRFISFHSLSERLMRIYFTSNGIRLSTVTVTER